MQDSDAFYECVTDQPTDRQTDGHSLTPLTKLGELGTYAIKNEILAPALQDLT